MLFGSTVSAYLLQAVLNYLLSHKGTNHPWASKLLESLYVGNVQESASEEEVLTQIYKSTHTLL